MGVTGASELHTIYTQFAAVFTGAYGRRWCMGVGSSLAANRRRRRRRRHHYRYYYYYYYYYRYYYCHYHR